MKKILYFVLFALLIINVVEAKKSRRNRPKSEEDSTPQPSVVTYSTFGFNDVGSYDGFVPSSPDYVNYLSGYNQDSSSTRLYAPAFPTAMDNYPSPSQNSPTYSLDDDNVQQASMLQYPQSPMSFMNTPTFDNDQQQNQNTGQEVYSRNAGESAPIYGTKIGSRGKSKHNNTDYNLFSSASTHTETKFPSFLEVQSAYENKPTFETKHSFGNENKKYEFNFNYATTHPTPNSEDLMKPAQSISQGSINFPKVIDFTKYKQYYPSELDTNNKFTTTSSTTKSPNTFKPSLSIQNENSYFNNFEEFSTKFPSITSGFKDPFTENKDNDENTAEKEKKTKPISLPGTGFSQNYLTYPPKTAVKDNKVNFDFKDKFKYNNNWPSMNYTNDFKTWKNPIKGYQYSTNFSNMNFEFDFSGGKKPVSHNNDEVVPASSNIVSDLTSYQFPESDYSSFKNMPGFKGFENEDVGNVFESVKQQGYKYDPEDYVKSLYSTVPSSSSYFGNSYKGSPFSSFKLPGKRPQFGFGEESDDVVHIPKRPYGNKYSYGKFPESKPTEWSSYTSHRPYKPKKPLSDWNKEVPTRFKSEEDLLGLRTHDTSLSSYLPTYKPSNSISSDYDYKGLVEKWRQSYLKAKYKDAGFQDFDGYASEHKTMHVPLPKPYPIEVPHPVIVPVPQPYPVRVPIPKPVAVPVVREITVPVEKLVPYAVYKKVPYPIEKPVPVPVEKEVQVPVIKPYPVPIPHIRPVFHHTRPKEDIDGGIDEDDDYYPRPETKKIPYSKRIKSPRTRSRRPTRTYTERNRRRWPTRRPSDSRPRRPEFPSPYKQYEAEFDDFENSHREYIRHCKRTGNC